MDGKHWSLGRVVWERKPGAPPPAMRTSNGSRVLRAAAVLIALALVVSLAACSTSSTGGTATGGGAGEKAPYKIGAVVSLTGPYATIGGPEKNVLDMEVARINAAGGVNGHKVDVVIEDDGTDGAKAAAAASKLIDQDKVIAILGSSGTAASMAMRQAIDRAAIPQMSMAGGNAITAAPLDKQVFQTAWSNKLVVPFLLKNLQAKGIKTIGIIHDTTFGKDGDAVLTTEAPKFGITIVADESFEAKAPDMTDQLTKIAAKKPAALVIWNASADTGTILKNAASLKLTMPIYGSHGNTSKKAVIDTAGAAANGFMFPAGKILAPAEYGQGTEAFKVATDFVDRYTKQFGAPPTTFAGHAYDALNITVEAMKKLPEGFTSAQLRDQIEKTSGFVGIGGTFTFSPEDHNGLTESDLVMYKIENGTWTVLK